jgi:hypothetical protein
MLLLEGVDVCTIIPCLENDALQGILRKDQFDEVDSSYAGMGMVSDYDLVAAFKVELERVVAICGCFNISFGIAGLEKGSERFLGIWVILYQ